MVCSSICLCAPSFTLLFQYTIDLPYASHFERWRLLMYTFQAVFYSSRTLTSIPQLAVSRSVSIPHRLSAVGRPLNINAQGYCTDMAITFSFIHHLILYHSNPVRGGLRNTKQIGCLYPSADVSDSGYFAFVPDVIPRYCAHVIVLVPFFSILLGSSWTLRKEIRMLETGSVTFRIDTVFVLCVNEASS